jgi:Zn-dependent peptidase ImmA (M78 family)
LTGAQSPDQMGFANASEAFSHWMQMVEDLGVLVFHMSRVDPNECQGLSLYEDVFPIIILNGADSPEVRTFTLFHELAHLIMRSGGVCQVFQGEAVETVCNRFAGEFLLPRERISSLVDGRDAVELIPQLATTFRVSQSAVAVRLRAMQLISQAELDDLLDTARRIAQEARERARERPGGPPAHRVKLRNLGPVYVTAVLDALDRDSITAVDAAYFLESKLSTVELMQDDLLRRRRA